MLVPEYGGGPSLVFGVYFFECVEGLSGGELLWLCEAAFFTFWLGHGLGGFSHNSPVSHCWDCPGWGNSGSSISENFWFIFSNMRGILNPAVPSLHLTILAFTTDFWCGARLMELVSSSFYSRIMTISASLSM